MPEPISAILARAMMLFSFFSWVKRASRPIAALWETVTRIFVATQQERARRKAIFSDF